MKIESQWCCSGTEPHFFTYDEKQRLIKHEIFLVYTYLYNEDDSMPYGAIEVWPYGQEFFSTFTYDERHRIVQIASDFIERPGVDTIGIMRHSEGMVIYDDRGNLVNDRFKSSDYTEKPSIYKTNKFWPLIFPVLEPHLHILSEDCKCNPVQDVDEETGQITWVHIPLDNDHLIDRLNVT